MRVDVATRATTVDWAQLQAALREEVRRVAALLRSIRDPEATTVGGWSIAELAMHLSQVWIVVPGMARRDLSRIYEVMPSLAGAAGESLIKDFWDLEKVTTL